MKNIFIPLMTVAVVAALLLGCMPGAPEVPPVTPPPDAYEEYVAGLAPGVLPVPREAFEQAREEGQVNIYDWAAWFPEEIYEGFAQEYGIKIVRDNFADYDEVLAKFKLNPSAEYDYVFVDSRVFAEMKELGIFPQLNYDWMPNANEYLLEGFRQALYDPGAKYGVPCYSSVVTYTYNTDYVTDPRIPSWGVLFEPLEEYKGKVSLLNNMYEVIGTALIYQGHSFSSDDEDELMEARDLLLKLKPYVMAFDSWPVRIMLEDEAWISHSWYGDFYYLLKDKPSLRFILPAEGSKKGMSYMVIPKGSPHPAAGHLFIDYIMRPQVSALLASTICYNVSNKAVDEFLSPEARELIPSLEYWEEECEFIQPQAYTGRGKELRAEIWEELKK